MSCWSVWTEYGVGNTIRRMTDSDREDIAVHNMQFSREGLRVLAFAYKQVEEEKEIGTEDEEPADIYRSDRNDGSAERRVADLRWQECMTCGNPSDHDHR